MKKLLTIIAFTFAFISAYAQPGQIDIEARHLKSKQYIMVSNNGKELLSNTKHRNTAGDNPIKGTYNEYLLTDFVDLLVSNVHDSLTASDSMDILLEDTYDYIDSTALATGINYVLSRGQAMTTNRGINTGGFLLTITGNETVTGNYAVTGTTTLTGATTMIKTATDTSTSNTVVFTSAIYGKTLFWSPTGTATATLPANGAAAGSWFEVIVLTDQTTTTSAATADTLITDGDVAADSVAFSTSSHKIGSTIKFISNGTKWIAVNIGSTTMTISS